MKPTVYYTLEMNFKLGHKREAMILYCLNCQTYKFSMQQF